MNLYQFKWRLNFFKGSITFWEGDRKVGQAKLIHLLSKSCLIHLKGKRYISHAEIFNHNRIRFYNESNDRQLAVLKFKLWNSGAQLHYKEESFSLKSSFLGIFGTHWEQRVNQHNSIKIIEFDNQILNGSITAPIPDEEKYHLLILSAIQSMLMYGFFFLMMLIVVFYVIL